MQKIRQQQLDDCGVACLAMFAGVSYEEAMYAFKSAGLDIARGRKRPFSSNFRELMRAASILNWSTQRIRFSNWSQVQTVAIVKVMRQRNGNWHWVVAYRNSQGIAIYDPDIELMSYSYYAQGENVIDFSIYAPCGNIIIPWLTN